MAETKEQDPFTGLDKMLLRSKKPTPLPEAEGNPEPKADTKQTEPPVKPSASAPKNDRYHDSNLSSDQSAMFAQIRRSVRARGTEQSIHRLSPQEKRDIKDIVYAYDTQGIRTSEVELTRIALNFLIADHKEHKKGSILAKVLSSLNE
ncbi:MAG: hypothetical protein M3Z35_16595 [Nitrospirota bacterium]|nr:hypothetical protein [Nitrospirota bacterium]